MTTDTMYLRIETEAADGTPILLFSDDTYTLAASTDFENPYTGMDSHSCETTPGSLSDIFDRSQLRELAKRIPASSRHSDEREKIERAIAIAKY